MIINPVRFAEKEYRQTFREIVEGYAKDGIELCEAADILHVEKAALRNYAAVTGINFTRANRHIGRDRSLETRRRISRAIRDRSPRYAFNGLELSPIEWSERTGIPADTIRRRIARGWEVDKALTTAPLDRQQITASAANARWNRRTS